MRKLNRLPYRGGVRIVYAILVLCFIGTTVSLNGQCSPSSGEVSGYVFNDLNDNGIFNNGDDPISNVLVTAYNDQGSSVGSDITNSSGIYTIKELDDDDRVRLRFNYLDTYTVSSLGSDNKSSIQFATVPSCTQSLGLKFIEQGCMETPDLVVACFVQGDIDVNPNVETLVGITSSFNESTKAYKVADQSETGSIWGVAYKNRGQEIYSSAFVKQYAGLKDGHSSIFKTTHSTDGYTTSKFVDLVDLGVTVAPLLTTDINDCAFGAQVGRYGLGALEISDNENFLYVTNLSEKTVVRIPTVNPNPSNVVSYTVPDPNCGSNYEVFALEYQDNYIYVGVTCTGEDFAGTDSDKSRISAAVLYKMDVETGVFTEVFRTEYLKGFWDDSDSQSDLTTHWFTDVDFTIDGNMILSFTDRIGHRFCVDASSVDPEDFTNRLDDQNPDILLVYKDQNGQWTLESNGSAGELSGTGIGNGQGPDGGEFFGRDEWPAKPDLHPETALGSIKVIEGTSKVIAAVYDPLENSYSAGLHIYNTNNGEIESAVELYTHSIDPQFGKATGFGDIIATCGFTPIQIGNYVWNDINTNGIQDANEEAIPGVNLELYNENCDLVGSTVTDESGYYSFNSSNVDIDLNGVMDALAPNSTYYISIATSQFKSDLESVQLNNINYIISELADDILTNSNSVSIPKELINNNASVISDVCESEVLIQITTPNNNTNDYSFDIGLSTNREFDLALMKRVVGNPYVTFGDEVEFEIEIYNQGNVTAQNVDIVDYLPSGLSFPSEGNEGWEMEDDQLQYHIAERIQPDQIKRIPLTLIANGKGTNYINEAEVSDAQDLFGEHPEDIDSKPDFDNSNDNGGLWGTDSDDEITDSGSFDEDDHDPAAVRVFDLALKYELPGSLNRTAGEKVKFLISVYNQGNVTANTFDILVYGAEDLSLSKDDNDDWAVLGPNYRMTVDKGLKPGEKFEACIYMDISKETELDQLVQYAEISSATPQGGNHIEDFDSTPDQNNTDIGGQALTGNDNMISDHGLVDEDDHDPVVVLLDFVDFALIKTPASFLIVPEEGALFNITVTNQGTVPAYKIIVVDYIPEGMIMSDPNWDLEGSIAKRTIEIPAGLQSNQSITTTIKLNVAEGTRGNVINYAEIFAVYGENDLDISLLDQDSTPDAIIDNDLGGVVLSDTDNVITLDSSIDEDDADGALVRIAAIGSVGAVCLDNATNSENGQFRDTIRETSLSGETWYIASVNRFYNTSSAAPPVTPTPFVVGIGGFNLIEDRIPGTTMSTYSLPGIYEDDIDFQVSITNGILTVPFDGDALAYLDPIVTGPTSLCFGTVETYSIPSIPMATYEWTVSGGGAIVGANTGSSIDVEWGTSPGGPFEVSVSITSDACIAPASVDVYLGTGGNVMSCFGDVNISLNQNCSVEVTPNKLSTVALAPNAGFSVMLLDGMNPILGNLLTDAHIGKVITGKLIDGCGNNSCWSTIRVEDKLAPIITCPDTLEMECYAMNRDFRPPASDNCNSPVNVRETFYLETPLFCDSQYVTRINASYIAEDVYGNESAVKPVVVNIKRPDMTQVKYPTHFSMANGNPLTCNSFDTLPDGTPAFSVTGVPKLNGIDLTPGESLGLCNIGVSVETNVVGVIGNVTKMMRRFVVYESWCSDGILLDSTQLIEILDNKAPLFTCPDSISASAGSANCMATVYIPELENLRDECGNGENVQIIANNTRVLNNIATLPVGHNKVTYLVSDDRGNIDSCFIIVTVEDNTSPVVVCDRETVIGIDSYGFGYAYASTFDDGSEDACGIDRMKVRRVDGGAPCGEISSAYKDYVSFCCSDVIDSNLMVELTVWDFNNNSNSCMVRVEVQDKNPPIVTDLSDRLVDCDMDVSDLSIFGYPTFTDTCGATLTELTPILDLTPCGTGTIIRNFEISDGSNVILSDQLITITNNNPFVFDPSGFPADYYTNECGASLDPDSLPNGFNRPVVVNGFCDMADAAYTDSNPINVNGDSTCHKIIRTWTIIDWCQMNTPGYTPYVADQLLVIQNSIAPTILGGNDLQSDTTFNMCDYSVVTLMNSAIDDCTDSTLLAYDYSVDYFSDGIIDLKIVGSGDKTTVVLDSVPVGQHNILWTWRDGCQNRTSKLQDFEVIRKLGPSAICKNVVVSLIGMDLIGNDGIIDTEMACLPISIINEKSLHPCGDSITLSFDENSLIDTLKLTCEHIGIYTDTLWVTDINGNKDYCTFEVEVQDNDTFNICNNFDLALIKTLNTSATNLPVGFGSNVTYDITVCNQGEFVADTIEVVDYVPSGYVFNQSNNPGWSFNASTRQATFAMAKGDGIIPASGLPTSGDSCLVVSIVLTIDQGATPAGLVNYAEICKQVSSNGTTVDSDSTPDKDPTNDGPLNPGDSHDDSFESGVDEDDYDVATVPFFDLALIKTTNATGPFTLGQSVQFDFTVTNQGNVGATNISIVDYVPCGLTFNSASNPGWTANGSTITFVSAALLAPNDSRVIPIFLEVGACSDANGYVNFGEISGASDADGNPTSDVDSTPDGSNTNDNGGQVGGNTDNTIDNENGDEDDHDPAGLELQYCDLCEGASIAYTGPLSFTELSTNAQCTAEVNIPAPTVANNVCNENIQITSTINGVANPGGAVIPTTFQSGLTTIVFSMNSLCDDDEVTITVNVGDGVGPECTDGFVHPDLTLTTTNPIATLDTAFILSQFMDVCGDVDVSSLILGQSEFDCDDTNTGFVTFSVTVSDNSMPPNTTICSGMVTVINDIEPICVTQDVTVHLDANGDATVSGSMLNNGSMGSCGSSIVVVTASPFEFDCSNIGENVVNVTITDANSNTSMCTATVTVLDTIAPVCNLQDVTVSLTGSFVSVDVENQLDFNTDDNCEGTVTFSPSTFTFDCMDLAGSGSLDTTVTVTVSDDATPPNTTTCTATITVVDNTVLTCATKDTCVYLGSNGMVDITPQLIDNGSATGCGTVPTLSVNRTFLACNDLGPINEIILTVSDGNGNMSTCTANVELKDSFPPVVTIADITVECEDFDVNNFSDADFGIPTVSDNCSQTFPPDTLYIYDFSDLNTCGIGDFTRMIIGIDNMGNRDTIVQTVTISNTNNTFSGSNITFPVMDTTIVCDAMNSGAPLYAGTPIIDLTGVDCSLVTIDSTEVHLSPGSCPDTLRKTWTIIDSCQFDGMGAGMFVFTQEIEITDLLAPVIVGPMFNGMIVPDGDTIIAFVDPATCIIDLDLIATATDCSGFTVDNSFNSDNTLDASGNYDTGFTPVIFSAVDSCGNISDYEVVVNGVDSTEMIFECAKLIFDLPDTRMIEAPVIDWFVALSGFACKDPSTIVASKTFGDQTDTLYNFDCTDLGITNTTLFIYIDGVFFDSCKAQYMINDPNNFCGNNIVMANISGSIASPYGEAIEGTYVELQGSSEDQMTDNTGSYAFNDMPTGGAYRIVPENDTNHDNGVSTLDLILIQRHILGISTFDSPYDYVAADINASGNITGVDVVALRKLILGRIASFPDNTSFRIMEARETFSAPEDALFGFAEYVTIPDFASDILANFIGIKVGDVNGSFSSVTQGGNVESRSAKWFELDRATTSSVNISATTSDHVKGFQLSLEIPSTSVSVSSEVIDIDESNYYVKDGVLNISWNKPSGFDLNEEDVLLTIEAYEDFNINEIQAGSDVRSEIYLGENLDVFVMSIDKGDAVHQFLVDQNMPNPWSDQTEISFTIGQRSDVTLHISDVAGKVLYSSTKDFYPGVNRFVLGSDEIPGSGVYYYTVSNGEQSVTNKMIIIR